MYFLAVCLFRVVVVELFSVFLCQGPSDTVSVGTSHKMKHPQIKRICFYSYDFCFKDNNDQRRIENKMPRVITPKKSNCEFVKMASKSDGERDFAGHCIGRMAVIHMGGESIGLVGGSSLPTPGRARNGRLSAGAEYSSVHPPPHPSPPKNRSASCAAPPLARVEVFPPGNFHFPPPPTRAVGASRASKPHTYFPN